MDSYSNRASSLFTTFTSVLFAVATLNHLTSYFYSPAPLATISIPGNSVVEYSYFKSYKADQLKFEFDLSLDLTSEYNWNVNQIYIFVVATYETKNNKKNEVVVYDNILREFKDYKLTLKNARNKYILRDEFAGTLANLDVTLTVRYQVMPIFGLLQIKELPNKVHFRVPTEYTKGAENSGTKRR